MEQIEITDITYLDSPKNDKNGSEDNQELEHQHFQNVVNAFRSYKMHCTRKLYKTTKYIQSLPSHQQDLLKNHRVHLHKVHTSILHNYEIIKLMLQDVSKLFENVDRKDIKSTTVTVSPDDMGRVLSVFKQIHREWTAEGKEERDASFQPILDEMIERFPDRENRQDVRVLIPGAGLGRLPYEIAKRGFVSQGNELSLFMLFGANFILNKCQEANIYKFHPWVHQCYNNLTSDDQVYSVFFPDVNPSDLPDEKNFSMAAGSFTEVYTVPNDWNCVITCFFLDTAHNIVTYIETIWKILKPGGFWINIGPLLYHHADIANEDSIEPTYQEIKTIVQKIGFVYCKEEMDVSTPYCQNPKSMLTYTYKSIFFVCEKPRGAVTI